MSKTLSCAQSTPTGKRRGAGFIGPLALPPARRAKTCSAKPACAELDRIEEPRIPAEVTQR